MAQVAPNLTTTRAIEQADGGASPAPGASLGTSGPLANLSPTPGASVGAGDAANAGLSCAAGRNGGATDTGVEATQIKLATTVVRSGIGAAFLGDVQFAMEAAKNRVNRSGGICGRQLSIKYVDDGWDASRGATFLRSFIKEGTFAIPVGPSSEGLNQVIRNGDIKRAGIPVVGTDGMIISQYTDPWVWPVAVSTASSARIMARNASARGAKSFAIVFDRNYKFGVEAAEAFNSEVRRLTKQNIDGFNSQNNCVRRFCGIDAGQPGYRNEVNTLSSQEFDFLAMFLEPKTALTWMATPGAPTIAHVNGKPGMIGLAQPLFTRNFAVNCQNRCHQMWVWTGYKPPIEDYANDPAVREYVSDLKRTKPDADESNAFAEGGYVGIQLLVEALKQVGPRLTRARLKAVLNTITFESPLTLTTRLRWPAGNYFAATSMQAFEIQYLGSFGGWRTKDIVADPTPQLGTS
ncbi:MAG: ABC transporter substrate-binding protein [Actinomycetota bacterium]